MCLITYSDLLPRMIHDELMKCLESTIGQQADNLADACHRSLMADGRNILEVIHKEGFMKKVPSSQVIITPTPSTSIRLDELNTILTEMAKGEEAVKKLAEMDSSLGMQTKKRDNSPKRDVGEPEIKNKVMKNDVIPPLQAGLNDVLTDEAIAAQQLAQATRMRIEAKSLLAEADRLEQESAKLVGTPVVKKGPGRPKVTVNDPTTKKTKKAKV